MRSARRTPRGDNDRSCVLLVEGEGSRLLLPGDISARIEPRIADAMPTDAKPLVLAVAHHGSRTSSSDAFIAATHPALAIVSAGWHSRYGHPHRRDRRAIPRRRGPTAQHGRSRRADGRVSGDRKPAP